jgi:hypothetical protein
MMTEDNILWRFRNGHEPLGPFGERLWSKVWSDCGFFYIPLATLPALNGKGPRLQGNDTILPDFEVTNNGRRAYMDSKAKTGPVLFRKANEWRHGIDRKNFEHYETMSGINRQKCLLGIVELFSDESNPWNWSGRLLMQSLGRLGSPCKGFSTQTHMVYWPRASFSEIGQLAPLEIWNAARGQHDVSDKIRHAVNAFYGISEKPIQGVMF